MSSSGAQLLAPRALVQSMQVGDDMSGGVCVVVDGGAGASVVLGTGVGVSVSIGVDEDAEPGSELVTIDGLGVSVDAEITTLGEALGVALALTLAVEATSVALAEALPGVLVPRLQTGPSRL